MTSRPAIDAPIRRRPDGLIDVEHYVREGRLARARQAAAMPAIDAALETAS